MLQQKEFSVSLTHLSKGKIGGCKTLQPKAKLQSEAPQQRDGRRQRNLKAKRAQLQSETPQQKEGRSLAAKPHSQESTTFTFSTSPL